MIKFLEKPVLIITGIAFILVGITSILNPAKNMADFQIVINSITSANEIRAAYGGMHIGLGIIFLTSLFNKSFEKIILKIYLLTVGGLVIGRILSLFIDGLPPSNPGFIWIIGSVEFIGALIVTALLATKKTSKTAL